MTTQSPGSSHDARKGAGAAPPPVELPGRAHSSRKVEDMNDNGLELMLTIVAEKLLFVENKLNRARQVFDNDDVPGMGFVLDHNAWCPKMRLQGAARYCACGLDDLHDDLREAWLEAEQIRASINSALAKLKGQVAK